MEVEWTEAGLASIVQDSHVLVRVLRLEVGSRLFLAYMSSMHAVARSFMVD